MFGWVRGIPLFLLFGVGGMIVVTMFLRGFGLVFQGSFCLFGI